MPGMRAWVLLACAGVGVSPGPTRADPEPERGYPVFPVVFFPPAAPVYGAKIADEHATAARIIGGRRLRAPEGLADFVADPFYPQLGTRLFALDVSAVTEARLEAYRTQRLAEVNALLNQFVSLHDQPAVEQLRVWREFARTQTPALVALENEAERLREELIADVWLNRINWNANRRWKLGAIKPGSDWAAAEAEFQVVRAAAYYQTGLVPQQRGLLREIAAELQSTVRKARGLPVDRADSDAMFFSPETSRLRLPANLPPPLREKLAAYNGQKAALKRELRATVVEQDRSTAAERDRAFEQLADRQWPHLGILEEMAEEIRGLLASHFEVSAPAAPPWLPAGLLDAIHAYHEDRASFLGELKHRVQAAEAAIARPDLNAGLDERVQRQREYMDRVAVAREAAAREFQEQHAARFAALESRHDQIRVSLGVVAEKQVDPATGRPLDADTLLRRYSASMEEFDLYGRETVIYANYRTAMLQPGLSPEQRRLLFGYALMGLAQPLPHGELMPRRNATRPYPSW